MYVSTARGSYDLSGRAATLIGRGSECHIVLSSDARVSRRHALISSAGFAESVPRDPAERFARTPGALADDTVHLVSDLGSSNGTFLNGTRLRHAEILLRKGDRIEVGDTAIIYDAPFAGPSPREAKPLSVSPRELEATAPAEIAALLSGEKTLAAVEAALDRLGEKLDTATQAVFVQRASGVQLVAARPTLAAGKLLEEAALASIRSRLALALPTVPGDATVTRSTTGQAVVPLFSDERVVGALVVERLEGESLGRRELVELAAVGRVLAAFLIRPPEDVKERTPFGVPTPARGPRPQTWKRLSV